MGDIFVSFKFDIQVRQNFIFLWYLYNSDAERYTHTKDGQWRRHDFPQYQYLARYSCVVIFTNCWLLNNMKIRSTVCALSPFDGFRLYKNSLNIVQSRYIGLKCSMLVANVVIWEARSTIYLLNFDRILGIIRYFCKFYAQKLI